MSAGRKRLLLILLGVAILFLVLGLAAIPYVQSLDAKTRSDNIIISGIPFILIFIGIIIAFIDSIIFTATRLNNKIEQRVHRPIELACIIGIFAGIIGMFQPFLVQLYTLGFIVLLISTLGFIFWSHIVPRVPADS